MKALSLWQPWASLIPHGPKTIETRTWPTRYRGLVIIHAAKRHDTFIREQHSEAQLSLIKLGQPLLPKRLPFGAAIAVATLVDCQEMLAAPDPLNAEFGLFGPGRYGWQLTNIRALPEPIPWPGLQGLWTAPEPLEALVVHALDLVLERPKPVPTLFG